MLGLCPVASRPIAGEIGRAISGVRIGQWAFDPAELAVDLAARGTGSTVAAIVTAAVAGIAGGSFAVGQSQGGPAGETSPSNWSPGFGFFGCCCTYQSDRFEDAEPAPATWELSHESEADWYIDAGKLSTNTSNVRADCLKTHPAGVNRYKLTVTVTATEPGDTVQVFASDNLVRAEVRFADTGYAGQLLLFINDICHGVYSGTGLVIGDAVAIEVCCTDDLVTVSDGSGVLSAAVEITSSKVALGAGSLTGTATFDDFRLEVLTDELAKCDDCAPSCTVVNHALNVASMADLLPAIVADGGSPGADSVSLAAGDSLLIQGAVVGYSGRFHVEAVIDVDTEPAVVAWSINAGQIVATVTFPGSSTATLRLESGGVVSEFPCSIATPPDGLLFRVCVTDDAVLAGLDSCSTSVPYSGPGLITAQLSVDSGGPVSVQSLDIVRTAADVPGCGVCEAEPTPCVTCSEGADVVQYMLLTIPAGHWTLTLPPWDGHTQDQCDAMAGSFVLRQGVFNPCIWASTFNDGTRNVYLEIGFQQGYLSDPTGWYWYVSLLDLSCSAGDPPIKWYEPMDMDGDDPICNTGSKDITTFAGLAGHCCAWDGEPVTIEALI